MTRPIRPWKSSLSSKVVLVRVLGGVANLDKQIEPFLGGEIALVAVISDLDAAHQCKGRPANEPGPARRCRGSLRDAENPLDYILAVAERLTKEKLLDFLVRLGASARTPGACFITGGGSAILLGWRETTIDVDLKFDPEPAGVFDAIPVLKRELSINVELASPADFIPPLTGWRERSRSIGEYGKLAVYHYDFLSQALSKLERGHAKDLLDVSEMLRRALVTPADLLSHTQAIRPQLKRYPAVDEESFMSRVKEFLGESSHV